MSDASVVRQTLLNAFGGEAALHGISRFSARLQMMRSGRVYRAQAVHYDFEHNTLYQKDDSGLETYVSGACQVERDTQGTRPLDDKTAADLMEGMQLNFFFHLRRPELTLVGPLNTGKLLNQTGWRLQSDHVLSPVISLNNLTGLIEKVHFSQHNVVHELHYEALDSGIMWPMRFELFRDGQRVLAGVFSDVELNAHRDFTHLCALTGEG